ncbi:hypothetical protein [Desulfohalovibrio reitneri]|uniref:hypothetical protein n=1 Tax=Desulfohalovibrio reitneri TaxID=1307759 RepID=UPI0004A779E3|nr:hypothetical protein [Desulfohalovibrio reitneri]
MSREAGLREHIRTVLMNRLDNEEDRRQEAVRDYLAVSVPGLETQAAENLAAMVPETLPDLYEKWVGMFCDRLFETVPMEQVEELCKGDRENTAALTLVYIMYLESATMEKQMAEDLAAYGLEHARDEDGGSAAATYIRARMAELGREAKKNS